MNRIIWIAVVVLAIGAVALHYAVPRQRPAASPSDSYPSKTLSNGVLTVRVYMPDAEKGFYRGQRFDWSGMIPRVDLAAHSFFNYELTDQNPIGPNHAMGPAEEFGHSSPPGYQEAAIGDSFLKIGVGRLRRKAMNEYRFWENCEMADGGNWQTTSGKDWMECVQTVEPAEGMGYRYTKRIELAGKEPALKIIHRLLNTGSKAIDTDHYCHNLISIDGKPVGPAYQIKLPFEARGEGNSTWPRMGQIQGRDIGFQRQMAAGQSTLVTLKGFAPVVEHNRVSVECGTATVRIQGDLPLSQFIVWAADQVVSPEPYVQIHVPPRGEQVWETRYTFEVK